MKIGIFHSVLPRDPFRGSRPPIWIYQKGRLEEALPPILGGNQTMLKSIVIIRDSPQNNTLLGTNISPPKGTFEDDVPFFKVGYELFPGG